MRLIARLSIAGAAQARFSVGQTASNLWSIALCAFMRDIYGYKKKRAVSCGAGAWYIHASSSRRLPPIRLRGELSALVGLIKVS